MGNLRNIFIALLALSLLQVVVYYPQMPDVMASHFDGNGRPNGWMTKTTFFGIHVAMMMLMVISFLYFPKQTRRFPTGRWSIPDRDYWFAPERVKETLRNIRIQMLVVGIATVLLLLATIQLAIVANLNTPTVLSPVLGWFLIAYFVFMAIWLVAFFRRFRRPPVTS